MNDYFSPTIGRNNMKSHSTTILTVRHRGVVAMGGDGQVTVANTIMKHDVNKIRRLIDGTVMTGFAGATADAFALLERFEAKLKDYPSNVPRAATELAKEWRTDRVLRRLEAMMAVADARHTLLVTGNGDVVQPSDGVLGIGSGGNFAVAAARALIKHADLSAVEIVRTALGIAADIDVYTNGEHHRRGDGSARRSPCVNQSIFFETMPWIIINAARKPCATAVCRVNVSRCPSRNETAKTVYGALWQDFAYPEDILRPLGREVGRRNESAGGKDALMIPRK